MKTVARLLREEGKTQEEVAALLGVDRSTVAKWSLFPASIVNVHNSCDPPTAPPDHAPPDSRVKIAPKSRAAGNRLETVRRNDTLDEQRARIDPRFGARRSTFWPG